MRIILELKDAGLLAIDPHNYIVADGIRTDKRTDSKILMNARYFNKLPDALEEMREVYQAKGLAKGEPAKDIKEFIKRMEKISQKWFSFIKEVENSGLKGLKKELPPPTE